MLYTVHTSFSALHTETGYIRGYSVTEKIDAPDKFTAKTLAWHHIVCGGEYRFVTFKAQNARVSSREEEKKMKQFEFNKEQIQTIADEVERRMRTYTTDIYTEAEIEDIRRTMWQGVYSTLCVMASNWPEVRNWTDEVQGRRKHAEI